MNVTAETRVFITGGAGFIGTALSRARLRDGATVLAYDDFSAGNRRLLSETSECLQIVRGQVENYDLVRTTMAEFRPTIVYHLAAVHYIPSCEADPLRALATNVRGTQSILLACRDVGVDQVIVASTSSVYADSEEPYTEAYRTAPRDIYGLTKLFAELLAQHFHAETGCTTTIGRFFNVYGPHDTIPHIIPEVLTQLAEGNDSLRLGNLGPRRDFIFIDDMVAALISLTRVERGSFEMFNIGSGKDYSIEELIHLLGLTIGAGLNVTLDPSRIRKFERPRLAANIAKIRSVTGWEPRVGLATGLAKTIAAWPGLEGRLVGVPEDSVS